MRRNITLCVVLILIAASVALAQPTSTLRGKVVQADGNTGYGGAAVTLKSGNGNASVYSANDGMFRLPNVPPGGYTLEVKTANETKSFRIQVVQAPYTDLAPIPMR